MFFALSACTPPAPPEEAPAETPLATLAERGELGVGAISEAEIGAGETHAFGLELEAGDYVDLIADQQGVDLVVRLIDPAGREVIAIDSPNGRHGPERLEIVAEMTGRYRLELVTQRFGNSVGRYRLRIEARRAATGDDLRRAHAAGAFARADNDRRQGGRPALESAAEGYREALEIWRILGAEERVTEALLRLAQVYRLLDDVDSATVRLEQALPRLVALGDEPRRAEALNTLGLLHSARGDRHRAGELYAEALELARSARAPAAEAAALNNLAKLRERESSLFEAVELYESSLAIWRRLGNAREEAVTLNNLGSLYSTLHETDRARAYLESSLELAEAVGDRRRQALVFNNLGALFDRAGRRALAEESYGRALSIYGGLEDTSRRLRVINNLGRLASRRGELGRAEAAYRQVLELAGEAGDGEMELIARHNLGWVHDLRGEPETALELLGEAWEKAGECSTGCQATILYGLARAHRSRGELGAARERIGEALELVRDHRERIVSRSLATSFFASRHELAEFEIGLLMEEAAKAPGAGFEELAFEASQRARARGFLDALRESRGESRRGVDPALLVEEEALLEEIATEALERQRRLAEGARAEELTARLRRQHELLAELERLRERIRLGNSQARAWTEPLGLAGIQAQVLDRETMLLHYELGEERSWLWAVTVDGLEAFELPPRAEVESAAREAARLLARAHERASAGAARYAADELASMILAPVASLLGDRRLLIVAEGALEYVPFAALPSEDGEPLIARHEVVRLSAASVLPELRREPSAPRSGWLAVVADPVFRLDDPRIAQHRGLPAETGLAHAAEAVGLGELRRLPGTRLEAEAILEWVPPEEIFLVADFEAGREILSGGRLAGFSVIHFATHAVLDSELPELSGIVLSLVDESGRPRDGFVRVHEIYGLELPAELVVLSACQTALGEELDGEGLVGLARAFSHAGARRLVVSLWQVDDLATAELMTEFYRQLLREKRPPAEALRRAQLHLARGETWRAPSYWAGFILLGDWLPFPLP